MTETVENTDAAPAEERTPKFGPGVLVRHSTNKRIGVVQDTWYDSSGREMIKVTKVTPAVSATWVAEWDSSDVTFIPQVGTIINNSDDYVLVVMSSDPDDDGNYIAFKVRDPGERDQRIVGYIYVSEQSEGFRRIEQMTGEGLKWFLVHWVRYQGPDTTEFYQNKLREAEQRLESLVEAAHEFAEEKDLCSDFDDFMERNGLPARERTFNVSVTLDIDVTVEARSNEEAEEIAEDELRNGVLRYETFNVISAAANLY